MRSILWAFTRAVQLLALLMVLSGLYFGIRNHDMGLEIKVLATSGVIFYFAAYIQKRWL